LFSNSGKGGGRSSEKGASQNSIPVSAPIPESRRRTNSGKITKYQQHVNYASGPTFHEEWHARREEWLSNYSNAETIRKYRPYVNKFIQYIQQQGNAHKHPKVAITRTLVNQFQQHVKTHATPSNQTMILSATSSFLKHLAEEDVTTKDRSKHIKIPAAPKPKKKKDLTIEQVKSIMNATDNQKTKALIAAAYFAGLRTKETVHLTASKCKTADGNMTITVTKASAKGKKERDVPIAAMGAKLLKPFIEAAKARGGQQYLFPGRFEDTHIVEKTMWNYIKKPARAAGLEDVASHHFRHAFASHGAQSGVDIATIKDQMGHSSLKTTSKYVHGKKDHASSVSASLDAAFEDKPAAPAAPAQAPVAAPSAPQTGRSATQELVQLVGMYKEGLLTKEEFIAAKKNLSILQ
jgi:site-specific recombinase XerD